MNRKKYREDEMRIRVTTNGNGRSRTMAQTEFHRVINFSVRRIDSYNPHNFNQLRSSHSIRSYSPLTSASYTPLVYHSLLLTYHSSSYSFRLASVAYGNVVLSQWFRIFITIPVGSVAHIWTDEYCSRDHPSPPLPLPSSR